MNFLNLLFSENKDYVREYWQTGRYGCGRDRVSDHFQPANPRYELYQKAVNLGGTPSQQVIEENIRKNGKDYRLETEGPHPVERFRSRDKAMV